MAWRARTGRLTRRAARFVRNLSPLSRRHGLISLIAKLFRDVRLPLLGVLLLLAGFECLWVKITQRIAGQLLPLLMGLASGWQISRAQLENTLFEGPGKIMR